MNRSAFWWRKSGGRKRRIKLMEKCTRAMGYVVMVLVITLIFAAMPTECEAAIYEDTLRLHILADTDEEIDQAAKLGIRDRVLEKYGARLSGAADVKEAEEALRSCQEEIERDVDIWLSEMGLGYTARVEIGREWYDTRVYEGFTLPSGYYTSVRILLGRGEGQNWWCVMYPPLCLDMSLGYCEGYSAEEEMLIGGRYVVKFKILEILSKSLSR